MARKRKEARHNPMENMIDNKTMCIILNVSVRTLYDYRKKGMPFYRPGKRILYDREQVFAWLDEHYKDAPKKGGSDDDGESNRQDNG